jgi:hypothetical protein
MRLNAIRRPGDAPISVLAVSAFYSNLIVEIGHFPSCPLIEIRRPCNSSSQTLSTVPAFPSVRITALPTRAALKCRSCKKGRYALPVHMIKLTETREITPYVWVHPDDDDRR